MADLPPPPPPTKQISARKKAKYDKFFQDKEAIAQVQASAAASSSTEIRQILVLDAKTLAPTSSTLFKVSMD